MKDTEYAELEIQLWNLERRVQSVERDTVNLARGGSITVGSVYALGEISGTYTAGIGYKDVDLTGYQLDADGFVAQIDGVNVFNIDASTGQVVITIGEGTKDVDLDGIQIDPAGIVGQAAGTDQAYWDVATGKIMFGGGAGWLDVYGLTFQQGPALTNWVKWISDAITIQRMYAIDEETNYVNAGINCWGGASGEHSVLNFIAQEYDGSPYAKIVIDSRGAIRADSSASGGTFSLWGGLDFIVYSDFGATIKASIGAATGAIDSAADTFRLQTAKTPASAGATGSTGQICWDSSYVYVCVATNTWKRAAISTW